MDTLSVALHHYTSQCMGAKLGQSQHRLRVFE